MMHLFRYSLVLTGLILTACATSGIQRTPASENSLVAEVRPGAAQSAIYLPWLANKRIGLIVNQTSTAEEGKHLLDFLYNSGISIQKIFALEHGLRGDQSDGDAVENGRDPKTGASIVSLYGDKKEPSAADLRDVDILVYDIQDVGVRTYTFISSLHNILHAAAVQGKPVLVLDRPNPNGDYIAGPVLDVANRSFVGMDPLPLVYGLTPGELAKMIVRENWYNVAEPHSDFQLIVVPVKNYNHKTPYAPPVAPSPNLPNYLAVRLYPSLVFFEASTMSVARGTEFPFQAYGLPERSFGNFTFRPRAIPGVSDNPPHKNEICYGKDLRNLDPKNVHYDLSFFAQAIPVISSSIQKNFLRQLSGRSELEEQLRSGKPIKEIQESWSDTLTAYRKKRSAYLIYSDGENFSQRLQGLLQSAVDGHVSPGSMLLWKAKNNAAQILATGCVDYACSSKINPDKVYDIASLTKLFTATSILLLAQDGKISLEDKISQYFPEYTKGAKAQARIEHLLRHVSGQPASNPPSDYHPDDLPLTWRLILSTPNKKVNGRELKPGERFLYSDVNFLVLGKLVEKVSGLSLDQFIEKNILQPLGMKHTGYLTTLSSDDKQQIVPTSATNATSPSVHDEKAQALGGVAGHAGIFSTAQDLALFAEEFMLQGNGKLLTSVWRDKMLTVDSSRRALGWDSFSAYSLPMRGSYFQGPGIYNHTGFTGTGILLDRSRGFYWILLTNRVYPGPPSDFSISTLREGVSNALGVGL